MLRSCPQEEEDVIEPDDRVIRTAERAVQLLQGGNGRFLKGIAAAPDPARSTAALASADPYAVVLGCSDSRVPPEIVFDETMGRLFVVRVASNVAGQAEIGSIEYAIARWKCPLIVVLGHTQCGGIAAALDRLPPGAESPPDTSGSVNLNTLLGSIRYNLGATTTTPADDVWLEAVRVNIRRTVEALGVWSPLIQRRVGSGELSIVGAIYHVETGAVDFLEA
jgi:carbonic anhydrase